MSNLNDYLKGLRVELRGAESLGKSTIGEIKAEIARVEKALGRSVDSGEVERATSDAPERAVGRPQARRR